MIGSTSLKHDMRSNLRSWSISLLTMIFVIIGSNSWADVWDRIGKAMESNLEIALKDDDDILIGDLKSTVEHGCMAFKAISEYYRAAIAETADAQTQGDGRDLSETLSAARDMIDDQNGGDPVISDYAWEYFVANQMYEINRELKLMGYHPDVGSDHPSYNLAFFDNLQLQLCALLPFAREMPHISPDKIRTLAKHSGRAIGGGIVSAASIKLPFFGLIRSAATTMSLRNSRDLFHTILGICF